MLAPAVEAGAVIVRSRSETQTRPQSDPIAAGRSRWRGSLAIACLGLGQAAACQKSDEAACLEQRQRARQLALAGEVDQAEELANRVEAECDVNSLSAIRNVRKLIAETRARREEAARREAREKLAEELYPGRRFVAWATAQPSKPNPLRSDETCAPPSDPNYGFCEAREPQHPNMTVRYHRDDPEAFRYAIEAKAPLNCRDLGEYRRIRKWEAEGARYELCELTGRELRHLSALLSTRGDVHRMWIFSQRYLRLDTELDGLLRTRR